MSKAKHFIIGKIPKNRKYNGKISHFDFRKYILYGDKKLPENELLEKELIDLLNSFLEKQKTVDRIIFVRRYYFGDSIACISEQVELTENNVSVKLNRMRKKLKSYLQKEGYEI